MNAMGQNKSQHRTENESNYGPNMIVANLGQKGSTMGIKCDCSQLWAEMSANRGLKWAWVLYNTTMAK
jgi:hypothetical protein